MLSKDANRGMDIVSAMSDFVYEVEIDGDASNQSTERILDILDTMILAAKTFTEGKVRVDSFFIKIVEELNTDLGMTSSDLITKLRGCQDMIESPDLSMGHCLELLRSIAKNAMLVTSERVDTKLLLFH
jgi:hypothetical protein